nr:hypothetical protein [Desulforamulus aquiferis]
MTNLLNDFCVDCDLNAAKQCKEATCLVGFAKKVVRFASQKGVLDIPGASKLIPTGDFKPYYQEAVARTIAESCKQCKECRDNHSKDCVISLVRTAMENAIIQEQVEYPGSVILYLSKVKQQSEELATQIATNLRK